MKRFVSCLDGTWNNTPRVIVSEEGSRVYRPTNVLKLARVTLREDPRAGLVKLEARGAFAGPRIGIAVDGRHRYG